MVATRAIVAGFDTTDGSPVVMTSADMVAWTEVASWPGAGANHVSVAGDTYFVATGTAFTADNYAFSFDGDTWTLGTAHPVVINVAWTGSQFVVVADNGAGSYRASTPDGPWTGPAATGTSGNPRALVHSNGVLVGAVFTAGAVDPIFFSTDSGASWSTWDPPTDRFGVFDLAFGGGMFVAVRGPTSNGASDTVLRSVDGMSWSVVNTGYADTFPYRVAFGGGLFVSVGVDNAGNTRTFTSVDGASWSQHVPTGLFPTGLSPTHGLAFWRGLFGLVNPTNGAIYTSPDGVSWSPHVFPDRDWRGIAAGVAAPRPTATRLLGMGRGNRGLG